MKWQISFKYNGTYYIFTIDEERLKHAQTERTIRENIWRYAVYEYKNELNKIRPIETVLNNNLVFSFVIDQCYNYTDGSISVSCDNTHILVFRNWSYIEPIDIIKNDDGKSFDIRVLK
jgi:hypothetical protein